MPNLHPFVLTGNNRDDDGVKMEWLRRPTGALIMMPVQTIIVILPKLPDYITTNIKLPSLLYVELCGNMLKCKQQRSEVRSIK